MARARVDADAFGELYDHYLPRIHGFLVRRLADRSAAEDVTALADWIQAKAVKSILHVGEPPAGGRSASEAPADPGEIKP